MKIKLMKQNLIVILISLTIYNPALCLAPNAIIKELKGINFNEMQNLIQNNEGEKLYELVFNNPQFNNREKELLIRFIWNERKTGISIPKIFIDDLIKHHETIGFLISECVFANEIDDDTITTFIMEIKDVLREQSIKFLWECFKYFHPEGIDRNYDMLTKNPNTKEITRFIENYIQNSLKPLDILEIGSGREAHFIKHLSKKYSNNIKIAIGIDPLIERSIERQKLQLLKSSIMNLTIEHNNFDLIFEIGVLGYYSGNEIQYENILNKLLNSLKANGILVLSYANEKDLIKKFLNKSHFHYQFSEFDSYIVITKLQYKSSFTKKTTCKLISASS